ncbi:MAG TPA: D-2-hydroxyacid dehydrogenase [Dehalococcoidia bacterium]|nr:D-2-hydroxyacid dehydrogenase [Dehalococcoidia bacterium]
MKSVSKLVTNINPSGVVKVLIFGGKPGLINEECQRMITAVSPNVQLQEVTEWVNADRKGDFTFKEQLDALLAEAEVIFGAVFPRDITARSPRLKWIQTMNAGVDIVLDTDIMQSRVMLTNASGIHGPPMREFVLYLMLMHAKQASLSFQLQREKRWEPFTPEMLYSKTCGILGLGKIGDEVARLAKAIGMRVMALDVRRMTKAKYIDVMLPPEGLRVLLSESDFVVIALPLTPETTGLIGEEELHAMKPTSYLINVARGKILDEEALAQALKEHWIAGAGLDALSNEPLPVDSKLWELPNLTLTPHVAGRSPHVIVALTNLFCENLRRYLNGEKLFNVVNKKKGF